jgi:hypothetical protein
MQCVNYNKESVPDTRKRRSSYQETEDEAMFAVGRPCQLLGLCSLRAKCLHQLNYFLFAVVMVHFLL